MATTSIELDIENITGVSDADDQFIVSAQKFVVSSVPKNLLKWASSETAAASHGGDSSPTAITLPVGTDNILSVRRGSYPAYEVPIEDSPYISDSNSLKLATSKFPKYWLDPANKVQIKPAPSDSVTAHVQYIDFSKLDDASDLRNAIIFHACAKEFTKLSSDVIPDWSDVIVPIAPAGPDFGDDLSISAVPPSVPTISASTVDTSGWSAPTYTQPIISLTANPSISDLSISATEPVAPESPSFNAGAISVSTSAPTYTKPTFSAPSLGSVGSLTLPVAPAVPTISTVSYTDATNADASASSIGAITVASVNKADISGNAPTYSKPSLTTRVSFDTFFDGSTNSFGDNDPGVFSISSIVPVAPAISTVSYSDATNTDVSGVGTISAITVSAVSKADISGDVPTYTKPSTAIIVVTPSVPTITTVSFTDPGFPVFDTQPTAVTLTTVNYSDASQTSVESLVPPLFESQTLGGFKSFEDWWESTEDANPFGDNDPGTFSISAVAPTAPSAPSFSTPSVTDVTVASFGTAPAYTAPVVTGDTQEITGAIVAGAIGTTGDFLNFQHWYDVLADMIETEEDTELAQAQLGKIQSYIQAYQSAMQNQLNVFNDANVEYQATIQEKITNAQIAAQDAQSTANLLLEKESKEYIQQLSKYQNELGKYQGDVQKEVQEYGQKLARYQLELGTSYTAWLETNNQTIARFQGELSNAQANFQAKSVEFQAELQKKLTDAQEANKIALQNASQEAKDAIENNNANLAKYNAESQNYSANIQKSIQSYSAELQSAGQTMQATVQDNQAKISKYSNELKSYDSQVQKNVSTIQADLQNELNEFNKENVRYQANVQAELAKHQSDMQKVLTQAQLDAQDAQQEAALAVDIAKFNKAQDQALALENAAKQIEDVISDNNSKIQKYGSELTSYQSQVQSEVQEYGQKLTRYQGEVSSVIEAWAKTESDTLQQYQLDIQNELNEFNKENSIYQANIQAELAKHQSDLQKVLTQAQLDAQDAQQEASLATDISKFNKAQDQALALGNASKQMEDLIADNASKIQKYQAELQSYQAQVSSAIEKWTQEEWNQNFLKYQNDYASLLQTYQVDVQNELNEFNKDQAVYQNELQEKIQEATNQQNKDSQEYSAKLQKYANELQIYQANINKEMQEYTVNEIQKEMAIFNTNIQSDLQSYQLNIQNELNEFNKENSIYQAQVQQSIQDAQLESAEEGQKLQKYSAELGSYQQDIEKQVQDFTNTLSKEVQEYQSKIALYTADLQKYQAEVASETQKTALNSQKAQLYEAEANKYYQWAVAEVQAYVQNNSKMIGMQMAAGAAQQK